MVYNFIFVDTGRHNCTMDDYAKKSFLFPATPAYVPSNIRKLNPTRLNMSSLCEETPLRGRRNIYLRIKPRPRSAKGDSPFIVVDEQTLVTTTHKEYVSLKNSKDLTLQFKFTKILGPQYNQESVFNEICKEPLTTFLLGGNCLLFAYGATNAGKTYTMKGCPKKPGVVPRTINVLFNSIEGRVSKECRFKPGIGNNVVWLQPEEMQKEIRIKNSVLNTNLDKTFSKSCSKLTISQFSEDSLNVGNSTISETSFTCSAFQEMRGHLSDTTINLEDDNSIYSVWVSYAEIYNECVYDLLDNHPSTLPRKQLILGETEQKDVYVKGLTEICVYSRDEAYRAFLFGQHNLHLAPTSINPGSSRSHSIFTIKLIKHLKADCPVFARLSTCSFVDMAGAERAKKTQNMGERMKESQSINTSLHVLGKCLEILRQSQKSGDPSGRRLPCRESKLTRLFQRALEGKDIFTMIVNINQEDDMYDETINVLKFSAVAKELEFAQPKKGRMCTLRSSRLSEYLQRYSCSMSMSSLECIAESSQEDSRYMKLLAYCTELKKDLEEAKLRNKSLEQDVRREVDEQYRHFLTELEKTHQIRLEQERVAAADVAEKSHEIWKEMLEQERKRRRRDSEESEEEDFEETIKEYEDKIKFLENTIEAMTGQLENNDELKKTNMKLQITNNKLQFEISTLNKELERMKMVADAQMKEDGDMDPVVAELRSALSSLQLENATLKSETEETATVLKAAEEDFQHNMRECKELSKKLEAAESLVATKDELIEELQSKLGHCHNKMNLQANIISDKEKSEAGISSKYQEVCEARDEFKFRAKDYETQCNKLQRENENLKAQLLESQQANKSLDPAEVRALEAQVASYEDQMQIYEKKIKEKDEMNRDLQMEMTSFKSTSLCSNPDSLEKEIRELQKEIKDLIQDKKSRQEKHDQLLQDYHSCQEDLKKTELALVQEQKNTKELKKSLDGQMEELISKNNCLNKALKEYEDQPDIIKENEELRLQILELEGLLKSKEEEIEGVKTRRDVQFKWYEDTLKSEKEMFEIQQREVNRLQGVFRNATPHKSEDLAEIERLKGELKQAHVQLADYGKKNKEGERNNKPKDESDSALAKGRGRRARVKKVQDENKPQISDEEVKEVKKEPEVVVKPDPDNPRQLRPRRKKLFYDEENKEAVPFETTNRPRSKKRPM